MLNKALTSACDVKSFSLRLKSNLSKYGIDLEHSKILEVVARSFQYKNWNVLSAKLKNLSGQLDDQKTIILHIDSSAKRSQLDTILKNCIDSSGFCLMPSSTIDETNGVSYVFDFKKSNQNNFITFVFLMSNSMVESKIIVKDMFFKRISVETESFNEYFSSEMEKYHKEEIKKAFDKMDSGKSVFHSHEEASKIMESRKEKHKNTKNNK